VMIMTLKSETEFPQSIKEPRVKYGNARRSSLQRISHD
jgi:hypothetical protein